MDECPMLTSLSGGATNSDGGHADVWPHVAVQLEGSSLNASQKDAVRSVLQSPGSFVQIVQGPPGTGEED